MVKQLYVKFGDPSCIGFFEILCEKNRQTNTHTPLKTLHTLLPSSWVKDYLCYPPIVMLVYDEYQLFTEFLIYLLQMSSIRYWRERFQ